MPIDPSIPLSAITAPPQAQSPFAMFGQFQEMQQRSMQIRQQMLQQQKEQQALDDESLTGHLMQQHQTPDGDIDTQGVLSGLQSAGRGNAVIAFQNKVIDWRKVQAEEHKATVDAAKSAYETAGRIAQGVLDSDNPQQAYTRATPLITALVGPQLTKQFWGGGQYDESVVKQAAAGAKSAADNLAAHKQVMDEADKLFQQTREYVNDQASQQEKRPKLVQDWTEALSKKLSLPGTATEQDWQDALSGARKMMSAVPDVANQVLGQFSPHLTPKAKEDARLMGMTVPQRSEEQGRRSTEARLAEQEDVAMTPAAIDQASQRFALTGDMGPMGMGKAARNDRNTIKNRAAEMYQGLNPAQQISAYQANKGSLGKLQATADALQTWENTGLKNARTFLQQAQRVVDTGSPWINEPLRKIDEKAFGSSNVATYNAARGIVTPEFAKLLTNPNLTGQLTDTARAEVNSLISGDFNYKQAYDVVKIFAGDAENRRTAVQDQIDEINKRLGATPAGVKVASGEILPPPSAMKTITEADIQAAMKAHGLTHDQAVAEAKKRGLSVQ